MLKKKTEHTHFLPPIHAATYACTAVPTSIIPFHCEMHLMVVKTIKTAGRKRTEIYQKSGNEVDVHRSRTE